MTDKLTVASVYLDDLCRNHVGAACSGLQLECTHFDSTDDFLIALGECSPTILTMPLDDDPTAALQIQKRFRTAVDPLCVIYLADRPKTNTVVQAMQLGACDVLSPSSDTKAMSASFQMATETWNRRAQWIHETNAAKQRISRPSDRQLEVLSRVLDGRTNKAIGIELQISMKTVEKHRQQIHRKTETSNLIELVRLQVTSERPLCAAYSMNNETVLAMQANSGD